MIPYSDLKRGVRILFKDQPYEILESSPMFKGRGQSVLQARVKNLITGETTAHTFRPSDSFEEPDIDKQELKFVYTSRGLFVFCEKNNPSKRMELTEDKIGSIGQFLKTNQIINGLFFEDELVAISMPIKIELKVTETPPAIKGQSASGGNKRAILETGASISVPLFINPGDVIEINTETNEYTKRIS